MLRKKEEKKVEEAERLTWKITEKNTRRWNDQRRAELETGDLQKISIEEFRKYLRRVQKLSKVGAGT